jgi:hypothetical protein
MIGSAYLSSNAASDAADQQSQATGAGIGEQRRQFDLARSDTAPYRQAGNSALRLLGGSLGLADTTTGDVLRPDQVDPTAAGTATSTSPLLRKFSVADFWNDPVVKLGYQSGLDLGTKALKNRAPLTTGLDSGAALKELTQFGTDYTGMKAGESQQRFVNDQGNQFNRLAALTGIGQTGVATATNAGINTANNVSNLISGQGNANAAARVAGANAWGGGLNSVANWWQSKNMMDRMYPQQQNNYPAPWSYNSTGASTSNVGSLPW